MLLGGVKQQATMEAALAEGFELLALGRALIHQPDLVRRIEAGDFDGSLCRHCNRGMAASASRRRRVPCARGKLCERLVVAPLEVRGERRPDRDQARLERLDAASRASVVESSAAAAPPSVRTGRSMRSIGVPP
jgi:hypothetical protein